MTQLLSSNMNWRELFSLDFDSSVSCIKVWQHSPDTKLQTAKSESALFFLILLNTHLSYHLNDIMMIRISPFRGGNTSAWQRYSLTVQRGEYLCLAEVYWVKTGVPGVKPL